MGHPYLTVNFKEVFVLPGIPPNTRHERIGSVSYKFHWTKHR